MHSGSSSFAITLFQVSAVAPNCLPALQFPRHLPQKNRCEKRQGRASFCHKSLAACFVHTICHQHPPGDKCGLASSSSGPSPPHFSGTRSRGHGEIRTDTFHPHTTAGHTSPSQALRDTNIRQCGNSLELRMKP
ncbi:hypothetical protein AOLI_G00012930 [Acnodon oligacanthus]